MNTSIYSKSEREKRVTLDRASKKFMPKVDKMELHIENERLKTTLLILSNKLTMLEDEQGSDSNKY